MAGGTKRLPRAVREQQMLDAAVEVFARKGFHDTSMDAIAAEAKISKPMLYLYYGSKDELFRACIQREGLRFIEAVAPAGNPQLTPTNRSAPRWRASSISLTAIVSPGRFSTDRLSVSKLSPPKLTMPVSASSSSPRNCWNPVPRTPTPAPISRSSRRR